MIWKEEIGAITHVFFPTIHFVLKNHKLVAVRTDFGATGIRVPDKSDRLHILDFRVLVTIDPFGPLLDRHFESEVDFILPIFVPVMALV